MKKTWCFLSCLFVLFGAFTEAALPSFAIEHQSDLGEFFDFFDRGIALFQERGGERIVESLSIAPQDLSQTLSEGSGSFIFAALAENPNIIFHPFCKNGIERKKLIKLCKTFFPDTNTFSPAHSFLETMKHFQHKIDLLSLQFISNDSIDLVRFRYQMFQELVSAFPHLSDNAIIMLNDKVPGRATSKLFIRYLGVKGWIPIYESDSGMIFSKKP